MAKLRLKQFDSVLTGSLNVSGSLGVSGSALTIDGKGSVSGSALSSGSFGRLNSYTLDIDSIQGNWTNAGNTVADGGTFTTIDINGGTVDGITSLTAGGDLDIGSHDLRAATLTADSLTSGRVPFASTNGLLIDDSDFTFSTDTLTVTKLGAFQAVGAIDFNSQAMTNVDINSGTINGITDLAVADGGTGVSTLTDGGVLLGSGTDAITATAVLTNGQLLIGDNSGDPTIATLTGTSNQVTVTNGAGSITLSTPQNIHTSATPTFGTITTTGNITGSSTSTGSFGELHIADKIGIGTTNPDNSSLHVAGHINLDDDKAVAWGGGSSRPSILGNTSNNTLKFYTNGSERISIASSGEVGIGTANPTKALHVVGDALVTGILTAQEFHTEFVSASIQYTSGSTKFGDTTDDLHSITGSLVITGSSLTIDSVGGVSGSSTSTGSFGYLQIQPDTDTGFAKIGRTFIGTTHSDHAGFSHVDQALSSGGYALVQFSTGITALNAASGQSTRFNINNSEIARLDATGLGIGNTSPGEKLDVTGNIKVSGNISGSATSTGSFGRVSTAGDIYSEGRIFESGTSVIDHATAMAIVFGG
tara:strand:- start:950 stop:2719 length:1770 start_codon:yes stop_codon:yes gene_type:complete